VPEALLTIADAQLLYADRRALARDFGELILRADLDAPGLPWFVDQVAVLSRVQVANQTTSTAVRRTGAERRGYRVPRYTRAALVPVVLPSGDSVLFDVKGCGIRPGYRAVAGHANGLLTLSAALHELAMERLVRSALRHAGHPACPLGLYAVIDLGVDVLDGAGRPGEPAVLLVRQARTRPEFQWGQRDPGERVAAELLDIELTLRRYGITASSSGAIRFRLSDRSGRLEAVRDGRLIPVEPERIARIARHIGFDGPDMVIDGVNVQVTRAAAGVGRQLVDFGCYQLSASFTRPLFAAFDRDCESLRGLFVPGPDPRYSVPVPRLSMSQAFDDPLRARLGDLATRFRHIEGARSRLNRLLSTFLHELPNGGPRAGPASTTTRPSTESRDPTSPDEFTTPLRYPPTPVRAA
jgi:hypothetical protein